VAIRNIFIKPGISTYDLNTWLVEIGLDTNGRKEVLRCYDVLCIWTDKFSHLGKLESLDHHSGGDDPPDVVARFDSGATLDLEHTSVEPAHRHWADKLRGGGGGVIPPLTGKYESRDELMQAMNPFGGGGWAKVSDEAVARYDLICEAIKKKIEKHPPGGVLVMDGDVHPRGLEFREALEVAASQSLFLPGSERWMFAFSDRANSQQFFSAMFAKDIPFEVREK